MAQTTKKTKKAKASKVASRAPAKAPARELRPNYRAKYEALEQQVRDVHRMLDAAECPPNCGTVNGRMVEFAKDWLRRCGGGSGATHPEISATRMLQAVGAPLWPL